jgi:hypothetical protein
MTQDFIGMKIGDLDLDSDLTRKAPRSGPAKTLAIHDRILHAGEIIEVPIYLLEPNNLAGLQFTLEVDKSKLALLDIYPNEGILALPQHFGVSRIKDGIHSAAFDLTAELYGTRVYFYSLQIEVLKPGKLSDMISVNSKLTSAMAFLQNGTRSPISLIFEDLNHEAHVRLFQNEPNPVYDQTVIQFYLPESTTANLLFYDANGKVLKEVNGTYDAGLQSFSLQTNTLSSQGLIYYELRTDSEKITRKMIIH